MTPITRLISLEGRRALITGAATGIGRAIARRFAEAGAALELVDVDTHRLQRTVDALTGHAVAVHPHHVDLASRSDIAALWSRLTGRAPDILVNNAGIYPFTDFLDLDVAALQAVLDVNLHAVVWMCQHMLRRNAARGGVIINVGSIEALLPFKDGLAHYAISKAGVIALTRALAKEYGRRFRVNAIIPGGIVTSGTKTAAKRIAKLELGLIKDGLAFRQRLPLGRFGRPDEVARIALVLASDLSSYVHGALIPVDGGFLSA